MSLSPSGALRHMPPPILCSPSTPSYPFFHFLSTSLFPFLSESQVRGSWVWSGCDAGCGWAAMVFVDRGSLRWFVVGLCGHSVSGFCDLISVSFNFSGFDWFWWVLDFGGWVRGLIEVDLGVGCGLIEVVQRYGLIGVVLGLVVILWFFDFVALDVEVFFFFLPTVVCDWGDGGWMWWLWNGWVDMVASGTGLWKRDQEERESKKERGKIKKKNKKW